MVIRGVVRHSGILDKMSAWLVRICGARGFGYPKKHSAEWWFFKCINVSQACKYFFILSGPYIQYWGPGICWITYRGEWLLSNCLGGVGGGQYRMTIGCRWGTDTLVTDHHLRSLWSAPPGFGHVHLFSACYFVWSVLVLTCGLTCGSYIWPN